MKLICRLLLISALAAAGFIAPVRAQDGPAGDPAPALLATINHVLDLVIGKSPDEITALVPQIRDAMTGSVAIDAIVRRSFGRNWTKLTAAQQTEAVDLLGRLMIRTYAVQIGTGDRPQMKVVASREIAPGRREVITTATQPGKTVTVVYRLAPLGGAWKVYDVTAENISLVGNYREQFDAHFAHGTAEALLQTLRAKLAAPQAPAAPAAK